MNYADIINLIAHILSTTGAAIIFYGGLRSMFEIVVGEALRRPPNYNAVRRSFTAKILVGLEFFVASDLITSILTPTLDDVIVLAIIVAIRTVVSYTLDKEIKEMEPEEESLKDKL